MPSNNESEERSYTNTPIYEVPTSGYSVEKLASMLLDPNKSNICLERPTDIRSSATYIIDLERLKHPDDAKRDNFGRWNYSGSHTFPFQSWFNETGDLHVERLSSTDHATDVKYLRRVHYTHPSDSMCKRMLAFITGQLQSNIACYIYNALFHIILYSNF